MEMMDASMPDVGIMGPVNPEVNANEAEDFGQRVDEMFIKVDKLDEVDRHLEELGEMVLQKCRRMSTDEKKKLQEAFTSLPLEDLDKALKIVSQNNPSFQATTCEVDLDMDSQSESTLWKLKFFVKDALQLQGKSSASMGGNNHQNNNNKRKKEICDALAKTSHKRSKKLTT